MLDNKIFYNLYISETYIIYRLIWVCCGYDVIVIYDVTEDYNETIWSANANSVKSVSLSAW